MWLSTTHIPFEQAQCVEMTMQSLRWHHLMVHLNVGRSPVAALQNRTFKAERG